MIYYLYGITFVFIFYFRLKDLHPRMPIANVFALHQDEMDWEAMYLKIQQIKILIVLL